MKPRLLVTGAAGQLGRDLVGHLTGRPGIEVVPADRPGTELPDVGGAGGLHFDLTDRGATIGAVELVGPRWIVHGAAWAEVDACEGDPDRAFGVNSYGTRNVAEAARRAGAHVCYISTDYVFDGTLQRPYTEWDTTNPVSVYGRSKLGGEQELDPGWTVARTSWLFGAHGSNMVKTVLRMGARPPEAGPLRFVDDQRGCPTGSEDLAARVADLALSCTPGVFHVTNQGPTTWYGLARDVLAAAGLDPGRVVPITTAELDPLPAAARPANSVLDNRAMASAGMDLLADWHAPMERLVRGMIG